MEVLLGILITCWLLAWFGIGVDLLGRGQIVRMLWWMPLTLVLGPLAALIYLLRRRPHSVSLRLPISNPTTLRSGHTAIMQPDNQGPPTAPARSYFYLLVQRGSEQDICRSVVIPASGSLTVRRARPDERPIRGTLLLHDEAVSRECHCTISVRYDTVLLVDTSTNGTFVDGTHIHQSAVPLTIGSAIRIGDTSLVLCDERQLAATRVG